VDERNSDQSNDRAPAAQYAPISDYALVGDCHGAALVGRTGSIDWACPRRFDAGSIFGRLLDAQHGGFFAISPVARFESKRQYVPDTMVLETRFETADGEVRVTDALAMRSGGRSHPLRQLLRVVECVRGSVELDVVIEPRFDYGSLRPWLHRHDARGDHRHGADFDPAADADRASLVAETRRPGAEYEESGEGGAESAINDGPRLFSAVGGDEAIVVSTDLALEVDAKAVTIGGRVRVSAGERRFVSLVWHPAHAIDLRAVAADEAGRRLDETIEWWRAWVSKGARESGPYADAVQRSALVLKALTTAPTGAIIAAPTTSLPERIGGDRNWDYRYCWVRDAAFTIAALHEVGHEEVATGFRRFLARSAAGHADDMQILYGCYGERRMAEVELRHLSGYKNSAPVRVGNGAAEQRQLDVYGEFVNAFWSSHRVGDPVGNGTWKFLRSLVNTATTAWRQPDQGLWEIRGDPRHFVYSKVMCWVAVDRGIRLATEMGRQAALARWTPARDEIRAAIYRQGIDPARGCFVQSFGSMELDASLLMLPLVGFIDARDPLMLATVAAIEKELVVDGFVRRYRPECVNDGVGGGEGTFLMCTFWLVDVLALQGRLDDARALFERLLALANDVGLYSEQYDTSTAQMIGNFPQAFTHVALINSAHVLARAAKSSEAAITRTM
jgi:GH15 family glucan-1,4-alpha-glucosidase